MKRSRFAGAFAVDGNIGKLDACWEGNESRLPGPALLKLFYEGDRIGFETSDETTILFLGELSGYLDAVPGAAAGSVTDSILWLYKKHGDAFARNLDGHFAIILYDRPAKKLLVIQDKYTCYEKIFWTAKDGIFHFGNNLATLCRYAKIDRNKISTNALYQYLRYSYTSPPYTIFDDVYQATIGEMIVIGNNRINSRKYDDWTFSDNRIRDKDEAVALYTDILAKSIYRLYSDHSPSAFLLSGGIDSSLNVALAARVIREPLITVGIGADEKFNTDAPYARMVSKLFRTEHHEYRFDGREINDLPQIAYSLEVPYFEPGLMLSHAALKEAAGYSKSAIGGEAADQIFGSCAPKAFHRYSLRKKTGGWSGTACNLARTICRSRYFENHPFVRKIENRLISNYDVNNWCGVYGFTNPEMKELLELNFAFRDKYDDSAVPDETLSELFDYCCTKLTLEYAFYGILAPYGSLSELHDITSHSPYIDGETIRFALQLDHDLRAKKVDSKDLKFTSKYLQKELANNIFPPEILNRPKQGGAIKNSIHFIDGDFTNRIKNKLLNSGIINKYFRTEAIQALFAQPENNATRIFLLINFDLWHHLFVSGPAPQAPSYTFSEYIE